MNQQKSHFSLIFGSISKINSKHFLLLILLLLLLILNLTSVESADFFSSSSPLFDFTNRNNKTSFIAELLHKVQKFELYYLNLSRTIFISFLVSINYIIDSMLLDLTEFEKTMTRTQKNRKFTP